MKNAGLTIGMVAIGLGLASIGFNVNGNQANATPAAFNAGPVEPTIVWYGVEGVLTNTGGENPSLAHCVYRAWSDGTIEMRIIASVGITGVFYTRCTDTLDSFCISEWIAISSPNQGLNARADINFDEAVNGADLALVLAAWGDAPRNDYPPSDCPLGLIP